MSSARKFSLFYFSLLATVTVMSLSAVAQQRVDSTSSTGGKKLYGEAGLVTNYVDKGVTQSDKSFALQAGFGYLMGQQSHLGFWGSSVKYPTNEETVNLRLYFDVKMDFTTNTALTFRYDFNRYYQSGLRNGNLLALDFETFSYHVLIETNSNWEGTGTSSTWFGFRKQYSLPASFVTTPSFGYSQISAAGFNNYFDFRLPVGYKFADVLYELAMTYNSSSSQFGGRGDMAFILGIQAKF